MQTDGGDAAASLAWAVKRHWLLIVNVVAVFVVLAAVVATPEPQAPRYEAMSIVAAAELEIRPEGLPRFSRAVFLAGTVAEQTVAATGVDIPAVDLVPDHVNLEPIEETVLLRVVALHEDPTTAERLADAAAAALTDQLNLLGPGVGDFVVLEPARVDPDPVSEPGPVLPLVLSGLAGLVFVLGLVGLRLAIRRPVLSAEDVARLSSAPILGTLALPHTPHPDPADVPGLSALLQHVFGKESVTVVVVGLEHDAGVKRTVALLFVRGMARRGRSVQLVQREDQPFDASVFPAHEARHVAVRSDIPDDGDGFVVIDGPTAEGLDIPQFLPAEARVVLVVREGARARSVQLASDQFLPGELTGIVFVPLQSRLSRLRGRRGSRSTTKRPESSAGPT